MIIAVSGHRKLGGSYDWTPTHTSIYEQMCRRFTQFKGIHVFSGGALGVDQLAAQAAIEMGCELTLALPFRGFDGRWPIHKQADLEDLKEQADHVHFVSSPPYSATKMVLRSIWMINRCDVFYMVWDGKRRGGTWQAYEYAKEAQVTIEAATLSMRGQLP